MENYSVYYHKNKIDGKIYVGSTSREPQKRWRANGTGYRKQKNFYSAIEKYGWDNFEHIVIASELTKHEAEKLEAETIKTFNSADNNFGYNMTLSGQGRLHPNSEFLKSISRIMREKHLGMVASKETKRKLSNANAGIKNPMYGKTFADLSRVKMSQSKHKNKSDGICGVVNINTGLTFPTVAMAGRHFGIAPQNISNCCYGRLGSAGKDAKTGGKMLWEFIKNEPA